MDMCSTTREAYNYWYRGFRVGKSGKYTSPQDYWWRAWTPAKGTEAWYQTVQGFLGKPF